MTENWNWLVKYTYIPLNKCSLGSDVTCYIFTNATGLNSMKKSRLIAYDFNSCCSMQLPTWLTECEFWINMFAYSHAMINPFIYITFNESFKSSFKKFLCCSNEIIPYEYSRNCKFSVEVKKETMIKERIFSLAIYRIWMEKWKIIQYLNGITLPFRVSLNQNTSAWNSEIYLSPIVDIKISNNLFLNKNT